MDKSSTGTTLEFLFGVENYHNLLDRITRNEFYKCQLQNVVAELLTLSEFQNIINTRRLSFPRCRLVQSGNPLPPGDYNEHCHSALGEGIVKLVPEKVIRELSNGATLVVDFAEDLSLKIRKVAEMLSTEFQEKTGATVFFSIGHDKGFTTHWDNSDTLVFQLSGRKKWKIFTPTLPFPVDENKRNMKPPQCESTNEFILNENEFIYLPRGYWHAPEPCDSHSLHISFAFRKRNGIDFMKSLLPLLSGCLPFREDINKFASDEEKKLYVEQLKLQLENLITTENLNDFLNNSGRRKFIRGDISLDKLLMEEYDKR